MRSQPRVSKRDRKLQLSYELPHRIHSSLIYPLTAPNGSTVVIYGHSRGLKILWRGGRRRRTAASAPPPTTNGTQDIVVIDDDDNDAGTQQHDSRIDDFEAEEEELDPDCPYPSIIQDLDVPVDHNILHVAAPALQDSTSALTPSVLKRVAAFTISSSDGAVRLLQVPLLPPSDEEKDNVIGNIFQSQIELSAAGPIVSGLTMKFLSVDNQPLTAQSRQQEGVEGRLLVAAASRTLSIWGVSVSADDLFIENQTPINKVHLPSPLAKIAFHPSNRSGQLLVADRLGAARIFDPFARKTSTTRPTSSDSTVVPISHDREPGKWVMTYHTAFSSSKDDSAPSILAKRKRILDANWVLGGKGIFALLEDSQWGVWDIGGTPKPGKSVGDFAIDGFLTAPSANEPSEPTRPRKGTSKLAPMTPNTRKTKSEQFYHGESKSKASDGVVKGGVSVGSIHPRSGQIDECITVWYNGDVYSIPSMQSFWQRSTTSGGGIGSLYSPGVSHVTELDPMHEIISTVSHFPAKSSSAGIGAMNTQRDLLVSTEYHIVVLQQLRPTAPARTLFDPPERPMSRDQQMLDSGTLDLAGMDRVLDGMAAGVPPARKVGFAS